MPGPNEFGQRMPPQPIIPESARERDRLGRDDKDWDRALECLKLAVQSHQRPEAIRSIARDVADAAEIYYRWARSGDEYKTQEEEARIKADEERRKANGV